MRRPGGRAGDLPGCAGAGRTPWWPTPTLCGAVTYHPMTLVDLAGHLGRAGTDPRRWRLIAEFLEEYRHEPAAVQTGLLTDEPPST